MMDPMSWVPPMAGADLATASMDLPELPAQADGWKVQTYDITSWQRVGGSSFGKRLKIFSKHSAFSKERIEELLGQVLDSSLGGQNLDHGNGGNGGAGGGQTDQERSATSISLSTYLFGASQMGDSRASTLQSVDELMLKARANGLADDDLQSPSYIGNKQPSWRESTRNDIAKMSPTLGSLNEELKEALLHAMNESEHSEDAGPKDEIQNVVPVVLPMQVQEESKAPVVMKLGSSLLSRRMKQGNLSLQTPGGNNEPSMASPRAAEEEPAPEPSVPLLSNSDDGVTAAAAVAAVTRPPPIVPTAPTTSLMSRARPPPMLITRGAQPAASAPPPMPATSAPEPPPLPPYPPMEMPVFSTQDFEEASATNSPAPNSPVLQGGGSGAFSYTGGGNGGVGAPAQGSPVT
eukprot:TRINITY_DN63920_c0_g1_i1.p1 TRINITY_DN63920_c0_g1~~TRINITY_DN63920_c0_g1_i1.p1  ORF type:complete len:406 (-),score=72.50 TRINITY_DN63920_c0_g1_i1:65-1282(-)